MVGPNLDMFMGSKDPRKIPDPTGPLKTIERKSFSVKCWSCNKQVMTVPEYHTGTFTKHMIVWFIILGFAAFCFWIAVCLPLKSKAWKDVIHQCPDCDKIIAENNINKMS